MKRIPLTELIKDSKCDEYPGQYSYIMKLIEADIIRPVRTSATNGKKPALHMSYWLVGESVDYSELIDEIRYGLPIVISTDYYLKHPLVYEKERKWVLMLARYLTNDCAGGSCISLNERSFQIWGREKFLQKEQGKRILKHCGISVSRLDIYETSEPLAYYSANKNVPQNILFIENKDTFYSIRRYLIEGTGCSVFGQAISTLVYGAGKGILRSVNDFHSCVEPYMNDAGNRYLYFGDLDYEGIGIYERLAAVFSGEHELVPFTEAYVMMLRKAEGWPGINELPDTKEGQNRTNTGLFFSYFGLGVQDEMNRLLIEERYIPQEILNIKDFEGV